MAMSPIVPSRARSIAAVAVVAVLAAGCERPSGGPGQPRRDRGTRRGCAPPRGRPSAGRSGSRASSRRSRRRRCTPGPRGTSKSWTVNIGAAVKKGSGAGGARPPSSRPTCGRKEAAVEQAVANRKQAEAAVEVAAADIGGSQAKLAEFRAGDGAGQCRSRPKISEASSIPVEELFDRHRHRPAACSTEPRTAPRGRRHPGGGPPAHVKTAEVGLIQARAALDRAGSDVTRRGRRHRRRPGRHPPCPRDARLCPDRGAVRQRRHPSPRATPATCRGRAPTGPPLFASSRNSDILTIAVNVPETFATDVNPGDRASVTLQAMKGRVVEGKVSRISWASTGRRGRSASRSTSPIPSAATRPACMPTRPSSPRSAPTC